MGSPQFTEANTLSSENLKEAKRRLTRLKIYTLVSASITGFVTALAQKRIEGVVKGQVEPDMYTWFLLSFFSIGAVFLWIVSISLFRKLYALEKIIKEEEKIIREEQKYGRIIPVSTEQEAQKAEVLFKQHQILVERYYEQNLGAGRKIFMLGIFCIVAGLSIIFLGLYAVFSGEIPQHSSEKIALGIISGAGAILSNFVGVVFLRMYSDTVKSLNRFHNRLVITHHVHFGNFLAANIEDKRLKDMTLSAMATGLSNNPVIGRVKGEAEEKDEVGDKEKDKKKSDEK